jgi:hypothetical protein
MTAILIKRPRFRPKQWVSFVGGEGIVQSCQPHAGTWAYLVEMPLGREPVFGRVGAETKILLNEADLCAA